VEKYTYVTVNERKFRIQKFNALTGSFMIIKIAGILAPLFKGIDISKVSVAEEPSKVELGGFNILEGISELSKLSEEDFSYVQTNCLKLCREDLPAGLTPVLNENGSFGVIGLEEDTMAVLALTVHALIFNVKGFFQGSPLGSIVGGFLNTSPRI
jgi:hypothetical protein